MSAAFHCAHASGDDWRDIAERCVVQLGVVWPKANLGFVYVTDLLAGQFGDIVALLRERTGVAHWTGTVGVAVVAPAHEYYDEPAMAVMIGALPPDSFCMLPPLGQLADVVDLGARYLADGNPPYLALVHGDPTNPQLVGLVEELAARMSSGFLLGGLSSARNDNHVQFADDLTQGGLSGVCFTQEAGLISRITQGCSPIGPRHRISEATRNVLVRLDGRPALTVFKDDIGEILARDITRVGGYIFAALPVVGSDTGDYLVRHVVGVDPDHDLVAIGERVQTGEEIMFCRRDAQTALDDMVAMLERLVEELPGSPRGGLYYSCLGRGINLFGEEAVELKLIRDMLGDIPLVGFYCNGEIHHNRLYGYTGVLCLFC